jgi:hypothetical protein
MTTMGFLETDMDKVLKDRWRKNFKEDMIEHREKNEKEVN